MSSSTSHPTEHSGGSEGAADELVRLGFASLGEVRLPRSPSSGLPLSLRFGSSDMDFVTRMVSPGVAFQIFQHPEDSTYALVSPWLDGSELVLFRSLLEDGRTIDTAQEPRRFPVPSVLVPRAFQRVGVWPQPISGGVARECSRDDIFGTLARHRARVAECDGRTTGDGAEGVLRPLRRPPVAIGLATFSIIGASACSVFAFLGSIAVPGWTLWAGRATPVIELITGAGVAAVVLGLTTVVIHLRTAVRWR